MVSHDDLGKVSRSGLEPLMTTDAELGRPILYHGGYLFITLGMGREGGMAYLTGDTPMVPFQLNLDHLGVAVIAAIQVSEYRLVGPGLYLGLG